LASPNPKGQIVSEGEEHSLDNKVALDIKYESDEQINTKKCGNFRNSDYADLD